MKKLILASAVASVFVAHVAYAADEAPAEPPEHQVAYNIGFASDYRFRGISQTRNKPAISAGVDYTNTPSGFYLGAWASNISWIQDQGATSGDYEFDVYGGKRGDLSGLSKDLAKMTYDVGVISYNYPGNTLRTVTGATANTVELYGQLGYSVVTLKYSHAVSDFIGWAPKSHGSNYIDLSANPELVDGYVLNLHVGKQVVKNYLNGLANYVDWKVGVTKDLGFAVGSIAVVGTDANKTTAGYDFGGKGFTGNTKALVTVVKNF